MITHGCRFIRRAALILFAIAGAAPGTLGAAEQNPYLEVPLIGRVGVQIRADRIEEALKYAEGHAIRYVVFYVDSQGGDALAARSIHLVLEKHDKNLDYIAVVRDAVGVSMVVPVWCNTLFVKPGATLGGVHLGLDAARFGAGVTPDIILANVALNAGLVAKQHGHSPELIQAMVDPGETVSVWRDESGRWEYARSAPPEIDPSKIALQDGPRTVLTLTAEQAVGLGLARPFDGPIDTLGKELGLSGWVSAGDAGKNAMAAILAPNATVAPVKAMHPQWLLDENTRRREATKEALETYLNLANKWDPKLGTYSTIKDGGWWGAWRYDTGRMTSQAKKEWRERTDTTIQALLHARQGILEMLDLDKQAKMLDLAPTYPEGKLHQMRMDMDVKIALLQEHREKKYIDERKPK
jgi:hypothetical protein